MKFKFLLFLFLAMAGFVSAQTITPPTPQLGDFRSVANGDWTNPAIWQIFNGSSWENTVAEFPGKDTNALAQATYRVFVQPGTSVTVSSNAVYYFGNLYILADQVPTPANVGSVSYGRLNISSLGTSLSLLGDNQDVVILGGILNFTADQTSLKLKQGATVDLNYYNGATCESGANLLQPALPVGVNRNIIFVDGTAEHVYASSSLLGGPAYVFSDLNCNGGSLAATLAATPNPVCAGKQVTLTSNFDGYISPADSSAPKTYVWTSANGATITTYDPNTPNLGVTLTTAGTHVFKVQVSYLSVLGFTVSADQIINVEVLAAGDPLCSGCFKDPALDTTKHPSIHGITSLKRAGAVNGDNWPMVRESAYTVLESNTKGFVINRLTTAQLNAIQGVDGMMAYDTTAKCLKLYVVDLVNPANTGWACFTTPACPNL